MAKFTVKVLEGELLPVFPEIVIVEGLVIFRMVS